MWTYNHSVPHSTDELQHHGVLGMKWGVRKTPNLPKQTRKSYKKYTENLSAYQRKENDSQVEIWRSNAKKRKHPLSRFNWGPLGKDLQTRNSENAMFKIYDYYSRNGKAFFEDRKDLYLSQWTRNLEYSGVDYEELGKKYIEKVNKANKEAFE